MIAATFGGFMVFLLNTGHVYAAFMFSFFFDKKKKKFMSGAFAVYAWCLCYLRFWLLLLLLLLCCLQGEKGGGEGGRWQEGDTLVHGLRQRVGTS